MNTHTILSHGTRRLIIIALSVAVLAIFSTSISDGQTQYGHNAIPSGLRDTYKDFNTSSVEYSTSTLSATTPLELQLFTALENEVYMPIGTDVLYRDAEPVDISVIATDAPIPSLQAKTAQCAISAMNGGTNRMIASNCNMK